MKDLLQLTICLAGGLALITSLDAENAPVAGNPYSVVVARNIFGLNPPPPPSDPNAAPVEPPVKITLNGIMSILGQVQALFKVAGKVPGKEDSYILSEGQRQDDIEVTKIDEKNGVVTFNNHGLEQIIPLVTATATSAPAPAPNGGSPGIPAIPPGGNFGGSGFNNAFGGRGVAGGNATPGSNPGADNGSNLRTIPTRITYGQQEQITPETQTVMMEIYREQHKDDPSFPTLPPTVLTPPDAKNPDGTPVVNPEFDQ